MSEAQQRRLGFGVILAAIGAVVLIVSLNSIAASNYGAMILPAVIGGLMTLVGLGLLARFFMMRAQKGE